MYPSTFKPLPPNVKSFFFSDFYFFLLSVTEGCIESNNRKKEEMKRDDMMWIIGLGNEYFEFSDGAPTKHRICTQIGIFRNIFFFFLVQLQPLVHKRSSTSSFNFLHLAFFSVSIDASVFIGMQHCQMMKKGTVLEPAKNSTVE